MTRTQRKHIEIILVFAALLGGIWFFQNSALIVRLLFLPVGLYLLANWRDIQFIESVGPSPIEVLQTYKVVRALAILALGLEIMIAYYLIFSGSSIGLKVDNNFGILFFALTCPGLPALVISQVQLQKNLSQHT
jgi:hypothetical protein